MPCWLFLCNFCILHLHAVCSWYLPGKSIDVKLQASTRWRPRATSGHEPKFSLPSRLTTG